MENNPKKAVEQAAAIIDNDILINLEYQMCKLAQLRDALDLYVAKIIELEDENNNLKSELIDAKSRIAQLTGAARSERIEGKERLSILIAKLEGQGHSTGTVWACVYDAVLKHIKLPSQTFPEPNDEQA